MRWSVSDKPLPWPHVARDARDESAMEAIAAIKILDPLLGDAPVSETERIRRIAKAMLYLSSITRRLESVGAPTRP